MLLALFRDRGLLIEVIDTWFLFQKCLRIEKGHLSVTKIPFNIHFFVVVLMIDALS